MNRSLFFFCLLAVLLAGCQQERIQRNPHEQLVFDGGQIQMAQRSQVVNGHVEVSVMARFDLQQPFSDPGVSKYFQYKLGDNMRLIAGQDTLLPVLQFYVPLISEKQKEIDCKFLLTDEQAGRTKKIILQDSLFALNKIKVYLK